MTDQNTKSQSTKYNQAVSRARNANPDASSSSPESGPEPLALTIGEVPTGALVPAAEARTILAARVAAGTHDQAPQLYAIPQGQTLMDWLLEGNGPPAEFTDVDTGVVREVQTWILSKGGARISILSSVQLDKKLPGYVGSIVSITRGEEKRAGRNVYTDYLVVGELRPDGKPRNWARVPANDEGARS